MACDCGTTTEVELLPCVAQAPVSFEFAYTCEAGSEAGTLGPCVLDVADHHERHRDEHGNEWLNVQWALDRLDAAPAGEVDTFPDTPGAGWGSSDVASAWTTTQGTSADM